MIKFDKSSDDEKLKRNITSKLVSITGTLCIFLVILVAIFIIIQYYTENNFIEETVTVTIDQGTLIGKKSWDYRNEPFYSFQGIPFAKPPIGALRFKAPEPNGKWSGTYDATKLRSICPQNIISTMAELKELEQNEDCLFLNVHSRMSEELKPVMVFFFGGFNEYGSIFQSVYGPEFLIAEDIVFVIVSFRLSIFGFSAVDDPKYGIDGNMGFKDQVLALKWVQNNIHHFGGDPNLVTIFGQSSGAASVNLLYLSPLAKGLFHRAIAQSGSAGLLSLTTPTKFVDLADPLKCPSDNLDEIVNCINQSTTENLLNSLAAIEVKVHYEKITKQKQTYIFNTLTIEKNYTNGSFLTEKPENIVKKGEFPSIPMIFGVTTDEGIVLSALYFGQPNFTDNRVLIPNDINIDLESEDAFDLGNKIKEIYYGKKTPSNVLLDPFFVYVSDVLIVQKTYKFAKLHANFAPTYFYQFNYQTKLNHGTTKYVVHGSDLAYLFFNKAESPENYELSSEEYKGIYRMVKLWTTFAKTGNPNPVSDPLLNVTWLPIEPNKFNYFKIQPKLELDVNPFEKRMQFWEEVYAKFDSDV